MYPIFVYRIHWVIYPIFLYRIHWVMYPIFVYRIHYSQGLVYTIWRWPKEKGPKHVVVKHIVQHNTIIFVVFWLIVIHFVFTNSHSEYVILTAFPLQQWLHESVSMLRHTNISCHVVVLLLPVCLLVRQRSKFSLNFVSSYFIGGNNSLTTIFSHH